ncbi:hypothetical protein BH10PSE15_BH10PSE15_12050 [soil metagenome]
MTRTIALTLLVALASPVAAQDMPMTMPMPMAKAPAPACPKDAEPIPPALAAWAVKQPLVAATDATTLARTVVTPGVAYDLSLAETPAVTYAVPPQHPGAPVSRGGMVGFMVASAGTYRVAIGAGAWLDLVRGTTPLPSVAHGHGPNCSGIRKMVDFALQPGTYALQIVGNATASIPMLIAKIG